MLSLVHHGFVLSETYNSYNRIHAIAAAAAAASLQSSPTLCDLIDGSPPGSSVTGILQARILEWVAISFSNTCMHAKPLQSNFMSNFVAASCPQLSRFMSNSVRPYGQQPSRLLCPRDSPGKNPGVGCHFLLHLQRPSAHQMLVH